MTWAARLALALTLAVAGLAKLGDREGARRTATQLGAPAVAGPVVSVIEIALAVLLVFDATAAGAALGAVALLAVFLVALARQLQRGVRVPCACFGSMSTTPAGPATLLRNAALVVVALFVFARLN